MAACASAQPPCGTPGHALGTGRASGGAQPARPPCGRASPRRLERHLVSRREAVGEGPHLLRCRRKPTPPASPRRPARSRPARSLGAHPARYTVACPSSSPLPLSTKAQYRSGAGGRNDTYGPARSATGQVAGAATYKHGLSAHSATPACPPCFTPGAPVPDGRTVCRTLQRRANSRTGDAEIFIPVTPLERVNKEIKCRTDVVGVFLNPAALLRLAGSVLVETYDEWQVSDRRYLSEGSMNLLDKSNTNRNEVATPALLTA
jgi:hypothetical protein